MNTLLVVITAVVSFMALRSESLMDRLVFFGPAISRRGEKQRFITYGFVHADFAHLFFNMFTLWSFGEWAQQFFVQLWPGSGEVIYVVFYLVALVVSIYPDYVQHKFDSAYVSLGASGAVSAVLALEVIIRPSDVLYVYGIPMTGWQYLVLFTVVSVFLGRRPGSRINHRAHLVGSAFGVIAAFVVGVLAHYDVWANLVSSVTGR